MITGRCERALRLVYVSGDTRETVSLSQSFEGRSARIYTSDVNVF